MRRDPRAFLWDIEQAADAISRFVQGMDSKAYSESEVVRSAVERKFEINFREIISFRNILIHGYAAVDDDRVYRITQGSLRRLRDVVVALQAELPC
jgi:uncharacterized protein with HEPN domain